MFSSLEMIQYKKGFPMINHCDSGNTLLRGISFTFFCLLNISLYTYFMLGLNTSNCKRQKIGKNV